MRRGGRNLTDGERTLWEGIARSIKPLRRVAKVAKAGPGDPPKPSPPTVKAVPRIVAPLPTPSVPKPIAPLDRRTRQKLARGKEPIDARLDLHGMTQRDAHAALARFLQRAQREGARFVLVVTGKGARSQSGDGERGVLRRQVPLWLRLPEFRELVVSFEAAHIGHGGEGALYVRVRKGR
jgi:DNA-nicking Smr family endonuclease